MLVIELNARGLYSDLHDLIGEFEEVDLLGDCVVCVKKVDRKSVDPYEHNAPLFRISFEIA